MSSLVPEDWNTLAVNELFDFNNGKAFYSDGYSDEGFRVIDLLNISLTGRLNITHKDKFVSPEVYRKYPKAHLKENDLIFIMTDITPSLGLIGKTAVIDKNDAYVLNQRVGCLRPKTDISMSIWFFNYLFNSDIMRLQVIRETLGTAQFYLNTPSVKNLSCPTPPLPEQKKIASILTSVDEVIENTQKQIDKLQDLKKATMNELLTKGIGHIEFKDSELGRIPKSWEVLPLVEVCEVSSSKRVMQSDYVDNGVPFYRSKEIILKSKGKTVQSVLYISEAQFINLSSRFGAPESGDILITAVGTIGVCYLVGNERFYFKDGNLLWLKNVETLAPSFLSVFLSNHRTRERIIEISGGSSQSALTIEKLSDFLVPVPSRNEQEKLSQIATSLDERIDSQKHKLSQTQSLKKSLMQDLLTGKVRVTVN